MLILQLCPQTLLPLLSERDNANVSAFAKGHRQYSSCVFSLHLWLKHQLVNSAIVDSHTSKVFISRIMQKHSISNVCRDNEFTGKKSLEQYLKKAVSAHLVAKLTK